MSKMNNNSRKNSKSSKKTTKKAIRSKSSSKKNFKIENLEPRLMMDASAGFDVEKIDDNVYSSQFEAIAATISTNASSVISSFSEFDVTDVGVPKKFNPPIQLFCEAIDDFEVSITNQVKGALNGALQYSKTKISEQNITNISLSEFVVFANEYVQSESGKDYKDIGFAVDGENESKLIVNVKLSNTTDVNGIEFNLGDIAKINAAGSRNLSSSLEFQVAIDLDKNSDGNYLESFEDFSVGDVVVKKLNAVVKDFGGSAEFMGLTIQEQANSDETSNDLVLSFDDSAETSKVTASADLEFALAGAESLPFSFAEGQIMKVSLINGKFVANVPTIQMKEGFLLSPKVSALIPEDSFVNGLSLKIDGKDASVAEAASSFNELMGKSMIALKGAVKKETIGMGDEIRTVFKLDATALHDSLKIVAGETYFKEIAVSGKNGASLVDESIELAQGTSKVIVTFTQSAASLNGLRIYSFDQNNLKAQLSLGVELTIDIDAEGKVSFTGADICKFNLDAYGIEIPNDQGYPINGNKNELHISKENDKLVGALKLGENLTMDSVFKGFSAADLPVFERLRIPVGSKEFTVADVASKMDVLWNFIPGAINANLTENSLDISGFASSLNSALAVDYAGLEKVFSAVELDGSDSALNLVDGENNLALKIVLNSGILEKLDLDLFDLNDIKMDTSFVVNVVLSKKNGVVSFAKVSLQRLDMAVNDQSVNAALFNGVDAELKDGKFNFDVSVVNEQNRLKVEKCIAELDYSEITFKSGSSNLLHTGKGNFSYSYINSEWNLPSDVVGVITHLEENSFSVANVIENAEKAPFFEETLVSNIASKVDEFRNVISFALLGQIQETGESMGISYYIDISALKSKINDSVDSSLKAKFKSVKIEFENSEVEAFDIFDDEDPEEYSIVGLLNGPNSIKVTFELSQEILNNLRVYSNVFSNLTLDTDICVKFDVNVGDGEGNYISDYSLKTFRLTVNDPNPTAGTSITIDSTDGLVVSYGSHDGSWSVSGVIFNAPKISFDSAEDKLAEKSYSDLKFDENYRKAVDAVEFLEPVSDFWNTYVFKALMSTVKWSDGKNCVVDTGMLKTSLEKILNKDKVSASTWFSSVKIVKANSKLFGSESNGFDICGGTSDSDAKLTDNVYFIVFTFNTAKLNELNLFSQSLKNLDVDVSVALKITLSAGEKALGCESTLESVLYDVDLKNVIPEKYDPENEKHTNVGLTGNVQILWDGNDWRIEKPDFVLDGGVSLKNELSKLGNVEIAALHDKKLNIGSKERDISDVTEQAEECWNCLMEVLYSKLAEKKQLITTDAGIKEITAAYKTALAARINDTSKRLFNDDIVVTNNGGKYTATFALKTSSIKALGIGGVNVGDVSNVTCKLTLSVDTSVEKNAVVDTGIKKDVVVFSKATLDGFYLELTKTFTETKSIEVVKDKYNAELSGAKFKLSVSMDGIDQTPETDCSLSCTSYDLKKNDSTSVYLFANEGTFAFVNDSWQQPSDLKNYLTIADSDQYSLKKQINLADNYQLPYVGDSLKIGGTPYTVARIIDKVDEIKTKILLAIQNELNQNKSEIDLSKVKNVLGNVSGFWSSIKLNEEDLLNATGTQEIEDVLTLEFTPKIDDCTVVLGAADVTTAINARIAIEVKINKSEKSLNSTLKAFTFDLPGITSANTYESSSIVNEGENLNVSITEKGVSANIDIDNYFEEYYLGMDNDFGFFDNLKIPLLEDLSFSVGNNSYKITDVLNIVDNYNRVVQYITDESIELEDGKQGSINLATLKSMINEIVNDKIPLGNVAIYEKSLTYLFDPFEKGKFIDLKQSNVNSVLLNEGENVLVFKISPDSLKYTKNINLGLVNIDNLSVGFDAYVKVAFYVYDGFIIGEDCYLDSLDLNLSVGVNKINLGLFDVELPDGQLSFKVGINPNADLEHLENLITEKSINLEYSDVIVAGYKLPSLGSGNTKESLSYNFDTGEWTLPESIRKFASFSSDNLITKVHTVLDTTQSALRNLVESKTKLDFLDGSIEKVVDVVDKVEKVVYGDGESGKRADELYGLCKEVNGQYQANFGDVQGFVDKFNESWCYFVLEKNPLTYKELNKICAVQYYYLDKNNNNKETLYEDGVAKENGISSVQFTFKLGFELGHDFGLNFAKSLGEQLANISTCGSIHVGADAKMNFTLKIDFESQKNITDDSSLSDLGFDDLKNEKGDKINVTANDQYITYETGLTRSFDEDLYIKIVKENKSEWTTFVVGNSKILGETDWASQPTSSGVDINYILSSRQIYVTANEKFNIENAASTGSSTVNVKKTSSGGDSFAELKLTGANLQTVFDVDRNSSEWNLKIIEDCKEIYNADGTLKADLDINNTISIKNDDIQSLYNDKLILAKKLKERINEYLSLQADDDDGNVTLSNGTTKILLSDKVKNGRSIMNTYGLYVVDVDEDNHKVIFGCDSRLIQSGEEKQYLLCRAKQIDAKKVDHVTYMRISGEINPSMNTAGMKGALVYETEKDTDSNVENIYYVSFDRSKKYNDEGIKSLNNNLDSSLKDKIEFKKVNDEDESIVNIVSKNESLNQYIVKYTDSILKMKIGTREVLVDVEKCLTVENLAETIYKTIKSYKNLSTDISSVSVIDGKIVFTAEDKRSNLSDSLNSITIDVYEDNKDSSPTIESLKSETGDFWIVDEDKPIDFQNCITNALKGKSSLKDVKISELLDEINNDSNFSGYVIKLVNDHFEIIGSDKDVLFTLNSIGTSKVLEWLGFTSGQESKLVNKEMKIVGSSVISFDWAKATSLEKIELIANLSLKMGHSIALKKVSNSKDDRITLYIDNDNDTNDFKVDGFIDVDGKFCRILNVEKIVDANGNAKIKSIDVSLNPINDESNIANALKLATWKNAKYVASASASVGFLGVDIIANGDAGLVAEFGLEKADNPEKASVFGYNVTTKLDFDSDYLNKFSLQSYADVFGDSVYLGDAKIGIEAKEDDIENEKQIRYKVVSEFNTSSEAWKNIVDKFKDFSIEKLYAVLETLLQRLDDITQNSDVKIPVINKSVRDLVNVANDLRDIIARLRAEKVTTIQKFGDLLNTYLEEFHLTSHTPNEKLFKLEPDIEGTEFKGLKLTFNIQKNFSTRHRFSFGTGTSGVHGNIDLDVSGDFWFALSAKLDISELDLMLNNDGLMFGADIGIAGDKLRFDLGINAGDGKENLLSNLISVGSDKNEAFIYGKVGFAGSYGKTGVGLSKFDDSSFEYILPVAIFGKLPVYACNMSLGDVYIGKCVNGNVAFKNCKDYATAKKAVEDEMKAYLDVHNSNKSNKLYVLSGSGSSDSFDIDIKTGTEENLSELNDKFIVDFSDAYQKISDLADFANMDWFSKIKLAVAGLNNLFEMLESSMNSNMGSKLKSVPVVGSALSTGVDFLSVLRDNILDPFSKFVYESTGLTAEMVAKKMNSLLSGYLLNVNIDTDDDYYFNWGLMDKSWTQSGENGKGAWYRSDNKSAEWFFNLGGTYDYGKSIDFDLGFPGLGLKSNAGLDLSLTWALEFGFGISQEKGFYFIFGDGDELSVKANASLNGDIEGALAGLGLKLDVKPENNHCAEIKLGFGVDLNESKNLEYDAASGINPNLKGDNPDGLTADEIKERIDKKQLSNKKYGIVELSSAFAKPEFDFSASVNIVAGMTVGVTKDLDRNTPKFPNITGRFDFNWEAGAGVKRLGFYEIKLDMGSFIGGVLGPIISKIQKVIEPLEPLIDFLTTPFPVLKDLGIKITPLDLAKKYSNGKFDDSMVYAIKDLIAISKTISAVKGSGLSISIGDFELVNGSDSNEDRKAQSFLQGKSSTSSFIGKDDDFDKNVTKYAKGLDNDKIKGDANNALKKQGLNMDDKGGWYFVWNDPSKIFKLLLGEDIDLVKYTMPKLSFDFDWSTFVRIWGPLGARIGVNFNASIQLSFGYDTLGIRQWVKSDYKDFGRLVNGFYVGDLDDNGVDINELSFYGGLNASAELNAGISAGVGGGVGINVGFNLYDPNKDGKVRLSEMTQIIKRDGLFGMFDVNGKITAKLYAYVKLLFYKKKWNITGDITLFEFSYEHKTAPVMASKNDNGDVVGHVGPNAGDRISTDKNNPSLNDGDEIISLTIEDRKVSWNGDSATVDEGKKLIIDGGAGVDKITVKGNAKCDVEILGGDGDDVIDLSGLTVEDGYAVIIWGGSGNDKIFGAKGLNIIFGDTGIARIEDDREDKDDPNDVKITNRKFVVDADVVADGAGDDIIIGNNDPATTRNIIAGGAGSDKIYGGAGKDIIFGDGGKVEFEIVNKIEPKNVDNIEKNDLAKQKEYKERATSKEYSFVAGRPVDGETVKISRTDISADGGNDVILGGAGDDYIYGGAGNDHVDGGAGEDRIYGERGHDIMLGGSDKDYIYGGSGHDIIFGDKIESDVDIDKDLLLYKEFFSKEFREAQFAADTIISKSEFEFSANNNSDKTVSITIDSNGSAGVDHIYGEEGDDLIFGDSGTNDGAGDTIEGGIGNDVIDGNGGDDTISGGIDNDIIYGGSGNDTIDGGAGNDSLYGDNGIRAYDKKGDAFEGAQITFGENIGLLDKIYKSITPKSGLKDGNDKIMTGPGMDFVDGQGGSDQIIVNLMGESETNYANITDTGAGVFDTDTLTIEGTEYNDTLLMRTNKDESLGFVALLPDRNLGQNEVGNRNIERVNFTNGIDVVNLNANGGDDKIYVDGTAKMTNIDGGAGDDSFQIGQFYNSERVSTGNQGIKKDDEFNVTQTLGNDKFLSDGVTKDTTLNVEGGIGNDSFIALRNAGALSMAGGRGNDTFSVYTYENKIENPKYDADDKDSKEPQYIGETFDSGSMSVDGGAGIDLLNVAGSTGDDTVIITKQGMLSDSTGVKIAGVETTNFDAGAGDDMFFVLGNNKGDSTIINGGHGNDTVSVGGGPDESKNLRSADTDGQKNHLKYEIVTTAEQGLKENQVKLVDEKVESAFLYDEEYTVIDTSNEPTVFYSIDDKCIKLENITVKEDGEIKTFYIGCSGDLKGKTISVKLTVPMLSSTALQHGDRGILIKKVSDTEFSNEVTFDLTSSGSVVAVQVKALSDSLLEEALVSSITVQSTWNNAKLKRSVNVISVNVEDDAKEKNNEYKNLLTRTDEFRVQTAEINLGEFVKEFDGDIHVYVQNSDEELAEGDSKDYTINKKDGVLTLKNFDKFEGKNKVLVVNYRSNKMQLDGSKIRLVYDNLAATKNGEIVNELKSVTYYKDGDTKGTKIKSKAEATDKDEIYYALYGDSLVFFYKANNRLASLHGKIEVSADTRIVDVPENRDSKTENKFNSDKFKIESVSNDHVIAEKGSAAEAETNFNTTKFKLKYTGSDEEFTEGKSVFVKIYAEDVVSVKDATPSKQLRIYKDNESDQAENYLILEFNKDHLEYSITVYADNDNVNEEYGYTTIPANDKNQYISDIEGNIYAYGEGASMESDFDDPAVLRYNHKFKDGSKVVNASKFNEKNSYDTGKMGKVSSIDGTTIVFDGKNANGLKKGSTVKFIKGDLESDWFYVESYDEQTHTFTVQAPVEGFGNGSGVYALFSEPKDYLFTPEADNTDRIFVNNQMSTTDATTTFESVDNAPDSVRFTNKVNDKDKQWQGELVANNFEFGEYNLGSGVDKVDIYKTHYRNDEGTKFQTFTVVNTGDGEDDITVHSYTENSDGQLVINAQEGGDDTEGSGDKINATSDKITKNGMIIFGGEGRDNIDVKQGVIAFGDKGNIQYKNAKGEIVTNLGYEEVDVNNGKTGQIIRTKISKENGVLQKQTDGVARGATSIKSVDYDNGKRDVILAGGRDSIVVGGAKDDDISVTGGNNVVLGDNGEIKFVTDEKENTTWHENGTLHSYRSSVQTIKDEIGEKDIINITGSDNVAMGGNGGDEITISAIEGEENSGSNNVVLGDGGLAEFNLNGTPHKVETTKNGTGGVDTITIHGGNNVVMGGAKNDEITIGVKNKPDSAAQNIVLGDGGKYVEKATENVIKTIDNDIGGVDTIKIYGGDNVVMGGFDGDKIYIGASESVKSDNNIVLGDGGVAHVNKDGSPNKVKTIENDIGGEDFIEIYGGNNVVMGGAMDDNITIGIENKPDSAAKNIVLGDGGKYVEKATENVIKTIDNDIGGVDTIKIYGGDNVVMGGFDGDKIYIGASESVKSDNNIVLGDGGVAHVNKDGSPNKVKTIENDIGGEDTIEIYGGNNVVMGGAMDDEITIGIENKPDSAANNIVLGDGGKFVNNETQKVVKTIDDSIGGVDTIHVYGGSNVVMGGAEGDKIYIGTSESVKSDNNVVLGDGGKYNLKKDVSLEIRTTSNKVGGTDTIEIHGGKNTVMGGFKNDDIDIFGNDNVVLGDGGIANYDKHPEVVKDNTSVNAGLTKVETTADKIVVEYADPDKPNDEGKRLNDDIDIHGDINIVMGGVDADKIIIDGADNVVVGDAGVYTVRENCLTVETKNEPFGGHDIITTGDGKNTILGGTDVDEITTGNGNDIIVGDGGLVIMDNDHNPLIVTNSGKNVAEENEETKSAGGDFIITAGGDNVIFGGLGEDKIDSGNGEDVVFGDNGYATFRGNAGLANDLHEKFTDLKDVFTFENAPEVRDSATLSFNFQGPAQWGIGANEQAGVLTESENHRVGNWNNIKTQSGQEAGTYGNDDKELVYFDDGTRASAVSVTFGASESHRVKTSDGANIRLHGYDQSQFVTGSNPGDVNLMKSGLEISGNNARNTLLTQIDGLDQYFTEYDVIVYLDMVRENSMPEHSVRMVTLFIDTFDDEGKWVSKEFDRFYVNDPDNNTFNGSWTVATGKSVETAIVSNCVIFKSYTDANGVVHTLSGDRFHVEITDPLNGTNGKDRAGIAGIQVCGELHKQDIAASTDIDYGSKDTIKTSGGNDIVVGGTGGDEITTYGDEYYGINDFDVVFGDNAKILLTDRDSKDSTASTLTHAESIAATNYTANYDDIINTGDGNDVVVGGIGHDDINAGATEKAQTTIDGVTVTSFNFVKESTNQSMLINEGESAGVVVDNHWKNVYLRNHEMRDRATGNEVKPADGAITFDYTSIAQWSNNNPSEQEDPAMDADTGNNKMMKTLVMGQKLETLSLSLHNLPGSESSPCDVYVYVGGKLEHGDAYDYVFEITGSDNKKFYLNDWAGNSFEGEFKEITCTSYTPDMLVSGVTPSVSMIGNYVVFRGIKTAEYTVQIRCVQTGVGNQQPNDIPVFTGVQIVSGAKRTGDIAVGGDHDKDLVFGDDAMLDFDLDIPFAGNENLSDYKNRVISATSMSVSADAARNVRTDDEIHTGIDRDVVVGGDGKDYIRTGDGDDVVLGDNASLKLENNNPIGVFRPDVEIVLEDNQYFQGTNEAYLDNDGVQVQTMEQKYYQGKLSGIALQNTENGRRDDIDGESGKDLVFEGEYNDAPLYVEQQQSSNNTNNQGNTNQGENNTNNQGNTNQGENNTNNLGNTNQGENNTNNQGNTNQGENNTNNQGNTNQGENNTGNNQGNTNQGENNQGSSNNTNTDERVETIGTLPEVIVFEAGKTIKLVCTDYPQGNPYWTPNICIRGNNAENAPIPELDWFWDGKFRAHTNSTNDLYVDIPDHPNGENGMYVIYVTAKTSGRASLYVNQ